MQLLTDRATVDQTVQGLNASFRLAGTNWTTDTALETWNSNLTALATKIATINCITEKQVRQLRALVQTAAATDQFVEEAHWKYTTGIAAFALAPLRGLSLYRTTAKIETALLEKELLRQEKRLAVEKRLILADQQPVFLRAPALEVEKRMRDVAPNTKTIVAVIPGASDGLYEVLFMRSGAVKVERFSIQVDAQFFLHQASGKKVTNLVDCIRLVLPHAELISLSKARVDEMRQRYYTDLVPRDSEEAQDWLALVDQEQPKPCLFAYNPKKVLYPEDTFQLVMKGGEVKHVTIQDNGLIECGNEAFKTVQEFENKYPVFHFYTVARANVEALKERVEVDLLRWLKVEREENFGAGVKTSKEAEAALLKAGQHDACIIWKELRYGLLPEQILEREEFQAPLKRVLPKKDADELVHYELVPQSTPPFVTVLSVRKSATGVVQHCDLGVKERSILLQGGVEACFFTTQGLSRERLYRRFEEAGFGMPLFRANILREKQEVFETLQAGIYQDEAALAEAEKQLHAKKNDSDVWYGAYLQPQGAKSHTWEGIIIRKYPPRAALAAHFFKRKIEELVVSVNREGHPILRQKGKKIKEIQCIPADLIQNCRSLKQLS